MTVMASVPSRRWQDAPWQEIQGVSREGAVFADEGLRRGRAPRGEPEAQSPRRELEIASTTLRS
jgi:hypothetical protein